jgi:hypothetical protein
VAVDQHGQPGPFEARSHDLGQAGVLEHTAAQGDSVKAAVRRGSGGGESHATAQAGVETG